MNEQIKKEILRFIKMRAGDCSEQDVIPFFGISQGELDEYLESLQEEGHVKCKVVEEYSYSYDLDQYEELCLRFRILAFLCKRKKVACSEIISKYNLNKVWFKDTIKEWKKLGYISINTHQAIVATNIHFPLYLLKCYFTITSYFLKQHL